VHRFSELIGKPIVSADSGEKLGNISDLLVDEGGVQLVGLVLGGGLLGKDHVLPFRDIQTLGGDVVVARTGSGVMGARQWRETGTDAIRSSTLNGKPVVTTSGHRVGSISDIVVNDAGAFDGLEVASKDLGGLRTRKTMVRPSAEMRIGPDVIVVPDNAPDNVSDTVPDAVPDNVTGSAPDNVSDTAPETPARAEGGWDVVEDDDGAAPR
jgi:uncharacterized protein YrrD